MTTLVQLALAFASIIVIGTMAAWLHDALEARRPLARRAAMRHLAMRHLAMRRLAMRRPAVGRLAVGRPAVVGRDLGTAGAPSTHPSPRLVFASPATDGQAPRRSAASSRTPAPHGSMRVVARRLGSHAVDA